MPRPLAAPVGLYSATADPSAIAEERALPKRIPMHSLAYSIASLMATVIAEFVCVIFVIGRAD